MYNDTFAAQLAHQHIEDLHREADARRLVRLATSRTKRTRKARKDFGWKTVQNWHVAAAY
jgi:hypothetical protein